MTYIGVIDVETTGLNPYRHDRIVELAVVVMQLDGTIVREFVTLVNPERDIGPTSIHGIASSDIVSAPLFSQIAGDIVEMLDGCVALAGHNVRFDQSFLSNEFGRIGYVCPDDPTICTMQLTGGGKLANVCTDYGIAFEGVAHTALDDARATAKLLAFLLRDAPRMASDISQLAPVKWPHIPKSAIGFLTRDDSRRRQEAPPAYLQKLLARVESELSYEPDDSALMAYTALLGRALEDRNVDDSEGVALVEVATKWGIPFARIQEAHQQYLRQLAALALADGVVTDAERRDLHRVANVLGIEHQQLDQNLNIAAQKLSNVEKSPPKNNAESKPEQLVGKLVCFTGECQCRISGQLISREMAANKAIRAGLIVTESVTKKLDLLVVADPLTQSGKAKKARQYGVRIMQEAVFWRALGVQVT